MVARVAGGYRVVHRGPAGIGGHRKPRPGAVTAVAGDAGYPGELRRLHRWSQPGLRPAAERAGELCRDGRGAGRRAGQRRGIRHHAPAGRAADDIHRVDRRSRQAAGADRGADLHPVPGQPCGRAARRRRGGHGFRRLETLGYGFVTLLATGGDLSDAETQILLRGVLSPAGHAAWTGLAAAALWWAHAQRWRLRGLAAAVGTFLLVVALHTLWDAIHTGYGYLIIASISFALLLHRTHQNVLRPRTGR